MSLKHRGRKPIRPLGFDLWDDERKIVWLQNKKHPTTSEKKELRFLTQKKKFDGFKEWLTRRREAEKGTELYAQRQRAKCRHNRGVEKCQECCRYAHCIEGKPLFDQEVTIAGEVRLGHAIILSIENDIKRCYKHGWKDQMTFWVKVLASDRTNKLTAETIDGYSSAQALLSQCYKKYGDFEPIYQKCQATYKPQLQQLEEKLAKIKAESKSAVKITEQIDRVLKLLYGDTM